MRESLVTFTLQVFSPETDESTMISNGTEKRVLADLPAMLESVEEDLEDLLPEGFQVRITEWDR